MKKYALIFSIFVVCCLCMYGCSMNQNNQEHDCKVAIEQHMDDIHGLSINNYQSLCVNEDGSASATVEVDVAIEGDGSMEMSTRLYLDENHQIDSCSLCDLGVGYNGGVQKQEKSSTIYRDFILRKTEQLTGFVISLHNGDYEEREIMENGHTYIDIFTFINIEEMAGTQIYGTGAFQLYALVNPDNEDDLFIVITGNSTGEIYRYDNTSIPHETEDSMQEDYVHKTEEEKNSAIVDAEGGLFLREKPSTNANKITLMPDGATVWVSKVEGNWAYVTYNDMIGWCAKEYIRSSETDDTQSIYNEFETSPAESYKDNEIDNVEESPNNKTSIGDNITFGNYNWKVLDIKGDTALIITEYIIGRIPYNNELKEITWENCSLRNYLNNEFYNSFSESDRNRIVEVTNSNSNNSQYDIPGGNPTNDKVFLLSIEEANTYDITIPEYVMLDIVWWLRSPGDERTGAAGVYDCGIVNTEGYYVDGYGGVRPALWLKLNS